MLAALFVSSDTGTVKEKNCWHIQGSTGKQGAANELLAAMCLAWSQLQGRRSGAELPRHCAPAAEPCACGRCLGHQQCLLTAVQVLMQTQGVPAERAPSGLPPSLDNSHQFRFHMRRAGLNSQWTQPWRLARFRPAVDKARGLLSGSPSAAEPAAAGLLWAQLQAGPQLAAAVWGRAAAAPHRWRLEVQPFPPLRGPCCLPRVCLCDASSS